MIYLLFFITIIVFPLANCNAAYSDNKISLQVNKVNLHKTLLEIQTITGIQFKIDENIKNESVSILLEEVEIEHAINRILRKYNKSYEYDQHGVLKTVYVQHKSFHRNHATKTNKIPSLTIPLTQLTRGGQSTDKTSHESGFRIVIGEFENSQGEMIVTPSIEDNGHPGIVENNPGEMVVFSPDFNNEHPGISGIIEEQQSDMAPVLPVE